MLTIQKFQVGPDYSFEMPVLATLLTVQTVNGNPMLWALVDTSKPLERRRFVMYQEGDALTEARLKYVASFATSDGQNTFHVFEVTK